MKVSGIKLEHLVGRNASRKVSGQFRPKILINYAPNSFEFRLIKCEHSIYMVSFHIWSNNVCFVYEVRVVSTKYSITIMYLTNLNKIEIEWARQKILIQFRNYNVYTVYTLYKQSKQLTSKIRPHHEFHGCD